MLSVLAIVHSRFNFYLSHYLRKTEQCWGKSSDIIIVPLLELNAPIEYMMAAQKFAAESLPESKNHSRLHTAVCRLLHKTQNLISNETSEVIRYRFADGLAEKTVANLHLFCNFSRWPELFSVLTQNRHMELMK